MKTLIVIAIAAMSLNTFAQDSKFDMQIRQRNAEIMAKRSKVQVSASHIQEVTITDDCHDVSDGLFEFGVEERITFEMEKTGKESIDFDYVADCQRFSNFLELNGSHKLSKIEIESKLDEITADRKANNDKKSLDRAWKKATQKFPSGPKL